MAHINNNAAAFRAGAGAVRAQRHNDMSFAPAATYFVAAYRAIYKRLLLLAHALPPSPRIALYAALAQHKR